MNIALLVVLGVSVCLVLGPVMMMRPTPAQKNKEHLHALARAQGVHFSLRSLPQQTDALESSTLVPVYFSLPLKTQDLPGWMLLRTRYSHGLHFLDWWDWQGDARPSLAELELLELHLPTLPESVLAISAAGGGGSVYWLEQGGEPVLQQILALLKALRQSVA